MHHYTLNTGHTRVSPRHEVTEEAVRFCGRFLQTGEYENVPMAGYTLKITRENTGLIVTISKADILKVTFAVAADGNADSVLWPMIEEMYLKICDGPGFRSADFKAPKKPKGTPWIAAMTFLLSDDEAWIGDFERCLAWAFIESLQKKPKKKFLEVVNHGPLIKSTNYWSSDHAVNGMIYVSVNAGAIRLLLPRSKFGLVGEVRSSKYVILSLGPWPEEDRSMGVEILFEDESAEPYAIHLGTESFDNLPGEPKTGEEWVMSLWVLKEGRPQKALERPVKWRRVEQIPCLAKWAD